VSLGVNSVRCNCRFKTWTEAALRFPRGESYHRPDGFPSPPNDRALVYAGLGEWDQAFAWLEQAYEQRDASLAWVKVAPESDALRSDRRFADLLRRMNSPA